ncbi:MAG: phosphoribosyltransferase family protein, partial [Aquirufa sp.]
MSAKQVLDGPALLQKIRRIAFQIYENNFEETEIVIAGIVGEGFAFAELLCEEIKSISKMKAIPVKIDLNKEQPYERPVKFEGGTDALENKVIIVVDDVLNTGRTFSYS